MFSNPLSDWRAGPHRRWYLTYYLAFVIFAAELLLDMRVLAVATYNYDRRRRVELVEVVEVIVVFDKKY